MKTHALSVPMILLGALFVGLAIVAQVGPISLPGDTRLFYLELDAPSSTALLGASLLLAGIGIETYARWKK